VERVFKTQVLQSLPESNERVQESRRKENLIKVIPHNSWHYSTLNNYNNSNLPTPIIKKNIIEIMRDNEIQLRDPSTQYKHFSSWKEKVRARIQDKIIKEVHQRNLSMEESWKKIVEKEKWLEELLKESDYVSRKQEKEILYNYIQSEESFSLRGGQRYLATSPENPSS
jgi:hypothetical protein